MLEAWSPERVGEEVEPVSGRAKWVIVKSLEPCPQMGLGLASLSERAVPWD